MVRNRDRLFQSVATLSIVFLLQIRDKTTMLRTLVSTTEVGRTGRTYALGN